MLKTSSLRAGVQQWVLVWSRSHACESMCSQCLAWESHPGLSLWTQLTWSRVKHGRRKALGEQGRAGLSLTSNCSRSFSSWQSHEGALPIPAALLLLQTSCTSFHLHTPAAAFASVLLTHPASRCTLILQGKDCPNLSVEVGNRSDTEATQSQF